MKLSHPFFFFLFILLFLNSVSALSVDIPIPTNTSTYNVSHSLTCDISDITYCWSTAEGVVCDLIDISTGDLTDDDIYVEVAGDTMTGDLELLNAGDNTAITIHGGDTNTNASLIFEEVNLDRWRLYLDGLDNNFYLWNDWSDTPTWMANLVTNDMTFNGSLFPWTSLAYDLGSGALRWRWLYVQNISAEYGDFNRDVNIDGNLQVDGIMNITNITVKNMWVINTIASGNSTADWFKGKFNWTSGDDWNSFDGSTLLFNESMLATTYYNATTGLAVRGTTAGTISLTQHPDGNYDEITFNITEEAGATGLDLRVNFTNVSGFNKGYIRYKTSALSGDAPAIQLWDYDDSEWEGGYGFLSETEDFLQYTNDVLDSSSHLQDGVVQMRLYKSANGNTNNHYYVDMLAIVDGYATPSGNVDLEPYAKKNDSEQNITANYGFFSWLGSLTNKIGNLFVTNATISNLNVTGNATIGGDALVTGFVNATGFNGTYYGNGQYLTGVSGDNSSWNESMAFGLFLNKSSESNYLSTQNDTYDLKYGNGDNANFTSVNTTEGFHQTTNASTTKQTYTIGNYVGQSVSASGWQFHMSSNVPIQIPNGGDEVYLRSPQVFYPGDVYSGGATGNSHRTTSCDASDGSAYDTGTECCALIGLACEITLRIESSADYTCATDHVTSHFMATCHG